MPPISLNAPAKLNLGLEVIGQRDDGYHEIATIFQAVSLVDTLSLEPAPSLVLETNAAGINGDDNLVLVALRSLRAALGICAGAKVELTKRIPLAAGLGGASSDAAAAIRAGSRLWDVPISPEQLTETATNVGSDVPFFLRGGTAFGTGRGERLTLLPRPAGWFVVAAPRIAIPRKTATLYAALTPADFSPGNRVRQLTRRLEAGTPLDPVLLDNAFARPLLEIAPALRDLRRQILDAGAPFVALSGAGPSHYTIVPDAAAAQHVATALQSRLGTTTDIFVCEALGAHPLLPE